MRLNLCPVSRVWYKYIKAKSVDQAAFIKIFFHGVGSAEQGHPLKAHALNAFTWSRQQYATAASRSFLLLWGATICMVLVAISRKSSACGLSGSNQSPRACRLLRPHRPFGLKLFHLVKVYTQHGNFGAVQAVKAFFHTLIEQAVIKRCGFPSSYRQVCRWFFTW